jgi:hypothetical protein
MKIFCTTCGSLMEETLDDTDNVSYRYCYFCTLEMAAVSAGAAPAENAVAWTSVQENSTSTPQDIIGDIHRAKVAFEALPKPVGQVLRVVRQKTGLTRIDFRLLVPDEEGWFTKLQKTGWIITGIERERPDSLSVKAYILTRVAHMSVELYKDLLALVEPLSLNSPLTE